MWKNVTRFLEETLPQTGLDIIFPTNLEWYNNKVSDDLKLTIPGFPENSLAIMIGNTRSLWDPFVQYYWNHPLPAHPIENYCRVHLKQVLEKFDHDFATIDTKVYWAHETSPGKLVSIQRMSSVSGFGYLCPLSNLSIHPTYGSWYAFRSVIVFNTQGPDVQPPPLSCPYSSSTREKIESAMKIAFLENDWKSWLDVRLAICPTHPYMYTENQIRYHYDPSFRDIHSLSIK